MICISKSKYFSETLNFKNALVSTLNINFLFFSLLSQKYCQKLIFFFLKTNELLAQLYVTLDQLWATTDINLSVKELLICAGTFTNAIPSIFFNLPTKFYF